MFWLADILVGSHVDYRPFIDRAHVQRSRAFHRIVLRGLSDHALKDIGITQGDIREIASALAARNQDLTVPEYRNEFVDQGDRGKKVSVHEVVKEIRDESHLRRAA